MDRSKTYKRAKIRQKKNMEDPLFLQKLVEM